MWLMYMYTTIDPEQFFCLLCKQVLHIEPFLSIKLVSILISYDLFFYRRPFGIDKEYFVPLFFQLDFKRTELPRTEKLIAQMFKEQNISFTHVRNNCIIIIGIPSFSFLVRSLLNCFYKFHVLARILRLSTESFHHLHLMSDHYLIPVSNVYSK